MPISGATPMERFRDTGETVWSFVDDILVQCPSCNGPAHVTSLAARPGEVAKLTCTSCGLARRMPQAAPEPRRCPHCNGWIPRTDWKTVAATSRTLHDQAPCQRCHRLARSTKRWVSVGAPEDPFFGLPLFLQAPCGDEILWAFNARHLGLLDALVRATVRERQHEARTRSDGVRNGTLMSRLPRWMKAAKNRESVLSCIEKLKRSGATSRSRGHP